MKRKLPKHRPGQPWIDWSNVPEHLHPRWDRCKTWAVTAGKPKPMRLPKCNVIGMKFYYNGKRSGDDC